MSRRSGAVVLLVTVVAGVAALALHPWRPSAAVTNGLQPSSVTTLSLPGEPTAAAGTPALTGRLPAGADGSARAAVATYLRALGRADAPTSYALLSATSRRTYPTGATWVDALADLPAPQTFTVSGERAGGGDVEVTVDVRREPTVNSFVGFVPARAAEVYRATRAGSGWRVDAEPVRATPELLSDQTAAADVAAWLRRVSACDGPGALAAQVSSDLLGDDSVPGAICAAHAHLRAAGAQRMVGVPATAPFLAAYGPDLGEWSRLVPVTGLGRPLLVGVAPIGSSWRVFGIVSGGVG